MKSFIIFHNAEIECLWVMIVEELFITYDTSFSFIMICNLLNRLIEIE